MPGGAWIIMDGFGPHGWCDRTRSGMKEVNQFLLVADVAGIVDLTRDRCGDGRWQPWGRVETPAIAGLVSASGGHLWVCACDDDLDFSDGHTILHEHGGGVVVA